MCFAFGANVYSDHTHSAAAFSIGLFVSANKFYFFCMNGYHQRNEVNNRKTINKPQCIKVAYAIIPIEIIINV